MRLKIALALLSLAMLSCTRSGVCVTSPDGRTEIRLVSGEKLQYSVVHGGREIISLSEISMTFGNLTLGEDCGDMRVRTRHRKETVTDALFHRQSGFTEEYTEAELRFKGWSLQVRAYDSGVAWRFVTHGCFPSGDSVTVKSETAQFNFPEDRMMWAAYSVGADVYANAYQNDYTHERIADFGSKSPVAFLPVAVDCLEGVKAVICESDLESYPGMFIKKGQSGLEAEFAALPDSMYIHPYRHQLKIGSRKDIIAQTVPERTYPWRIVVVSDADKELPVNNLVYSLAKPYEGRAEDWSWVRPGLCAWEWWNSYGLEDVDFKPGVNTRTYYAYIDFAAKLGLPYIVIDEGWSERDDVMEIRRGTDLDLEAVLKYASDKGVGVFLWVVANVLDDKLEEASAKYSSLGVKGFKVDFFDRDDQQAVEMVYRICGAAARHRLMVNLHGIYKPTGLNRTFPNAVNFEGVYGLEEVKWASPASVEYDVTFPFIRQVQGPSDYTQGAFVNATESGFKIDYHHPMSKGTRARQVASYVVFDSPLAMMCDSPSHYLKDLPCAKFIASIPTVFDSTEILDGEIGEYIVTKREKEGTVYIGALNNWEAREMEFSFSFLDPDTEYRMTALLDNGESDTRPERYEIIKDNIGRNSGYSVRLAKGGGCAMIIEPVTKSEL